LLERSKTISDKLPEAYRSAYYQLVLFPVQISKNLIEMYVAAGKNRLYALQNRASTNLYAEKVKEKFFRDEELTNYFHEKLSNGKWNHMMAQTHIGYTGWNNPPVNKMPEVSYLQVPPSAGLGYVLENGIARPGWSFGGLYSQSFPPFDPKNDQKYYIEIFNRGSERLQYSITSKNEWIKLSFESGAIQYDEKIFVSVDWDKAPKGRATADVIIAGGGQAFTVKVPIRNELLKGSGFIENNGVVSMEAVNFTRKFNPRGISWTVIPNMGRTHSAITVEPANAAAQLPDKGAPRLEYDFTVFNECVLTVDAYLSPTLNFKKDEGLKYAVAIDNEPPQIVNIHQGDSIPDWEYPDWWNISVTDRIRKKQSVHKTVEPGSHVLKIWMIDPGVVFQKFVIDAGGLKSSYLGPPESKIIK
jgi:hypothetical protein